MDGHAGFLVIATISTLHPPDSPEDEGLTFYWSGGWKVTIIATSFLEALNFTVMTLFGHYWQITLFKKKLFASKITLSYFETIQQLG